MPVQLSFSRWIWARKCYPLAVSEFWGEKSTTWKYLLQIRGFDLLISPSQFLREMLFHFKIFLSLDGLGSLAEINRIIFEDLFQINLWKFSSLLSVKAVMMIQRCLLYPHFVSRLSSKLNSRYSTPSSLFNQCGREITCYNRIRFWYLLLLHFSPPHILWIIWQCLSWLCSQTFLLDKFSKDLLRP